MRLRDQEIESLDKEIAELRRMPKRVAKKVRKVNEALLTSLRGSITKLGSSMAEREQSFI